MKVVMVHGRAQQGRDPAGLKKEWQDALAYGMARAEVSMPSTTAIELPFYGDRLDELVKQTETPLGSDANAKGTATDAEPTFRGEMLEQVAAAMGVTRADIEREYAGLAQQKGPANWEWVHAILRAMDRVPGVTSAAIDLITRDVYVYLTFPGVRAQIDAIVGDAIGDEPCVVVSHSLGTVVAYNVLLKRLAAPAVPMFATLGSPLGIQAIKQHLDAPLSSPACVERWFNAYDDRDVVALYPLDALNFDVTPPIENKRDVLNFTDSRHGIAGYLADPVIAARVVQYL